MKRSFRVKQEHEPNISTGPKGMLGASFFFLIGNLFRSILKENGINFQFEVS